MHLRRKFGLLQRSTINEQTKSWRQVATLTTRWGNRCLNVCMYVCLFGWMDQLMDGLKKEIKLKLFILYQIILGGLFIYKYILACRAGIIWR